MKEYHFTTIKDTHLSPNIVAASFLSIFAWNPPTIHSCPFGAFPSLLLPATPAPPLLPLTFPAILCISGDSLAPFLAAVLSEALAATPTPNRAPVASRRVVICDIDSGCNLCSLSLKSVLVLSSSLSN